MVVGASSMEDLEDNDAELDHYFVVKEVAGPYSPIPRECYFIVK